MSCFWPKVPFRIKNLKCQKLNSYRNPFFVFGQTGPGQDTLPKPVCYSGTPYTSTKTYHAWNIKSNLSSFHLEKVQKLQCELHHENVKTAKKLRFLGQGRSKTQKRGKMTQSAWCSKVKPQVDLKKKKFKREAQLCCGASRNNLFFQLANFNFETFNGAILNVELETLIVKQIWSTARRNWCRCRANIMTLQPSERARKFEFLRRVQGAQA